VVHATKRVEASACCGGLGDLLSPKLFKALSDPKRLSLLIRLAEGREACTVGQMAQGSGVDLSVVSRHLAILREAGVIRCEKRGKEVWCVVQTGAVVKILRDLADALEACCPDGWRVVDAPGDAVRKRPATRRARARH
jgi:DNA-binding transcriptional ArsR family regulator